MRLHMLLLCLAQFSILSTHVAGQTSRMCKVTGTMRESTAEEMLEDVTSLYRERRLDMLIKVTKSLSPAHSSSSKIQNIVGAALAELGQKDEAAARFELSIGLDPSQSAAYHNLGIVLNDQGKPSRAVQVLQRATEIDPTLAAAFRDLAGALMAQAVMGGNNTDLEPALNAVSRALELQPSSHTAHNLRGIIFRKAGVLGRAASSFATAVSLAPKYYHGYHNQGKYSCSLTLFYLLFYL